MSKPKEVEINVSAPKLWKKVMHILESEKLEVLGMLTTGERVSAVARCFGINECTVQRKENPLERF
jgi:hypothetical protein